MKWRVEIPRFVASTVEMARAGARAICDGRDATMQNVWQLPPHAVAIVGRPAVWFSFDARSPRLGRGALSIPPLHFAYESDFGGHLYLVVAHADGANLTVVESGPANVKGTGALVPFEYPEDDFAKRGLLDFDPLVIEPPLGMSQRAFAELIVAAHRAYDGNQRYRAIEIPFLRVGRDSNSYVLGVLRVCGVDPRETPQIKMVRRWEWTGYPGSEDPVHPSNFGTYLGEPNRQGDGTYDVASFDERGDVRFVLVGGDPHGVARLPDGTSATLDQLGRRMFSADDARAVRLPTKHTAPPSHIRNRVRFPSKPEPAGAQITIVVDGETVPLETNSRFRGTVDARSDALALAFLSGDHELVLPLEDLGFELRDPHRVDRLFRPGTELTLGLDRNRHPRLRAHGWRGGTDRLRGRRFHAPRAVNIVGTAAIVVVAAIAVAGAIMGGRQGSP